MVLPGKGVTSWVGRQHRRERSEGQPPRSMGGGRADQRHPPLLGHLRAHNGQCRLAYAGGTGDQPPFGDEGARQLRELFVPTDHGPPVHARV